MKALSLFSGIGGIDLACEWAGIETVAFCEREPFPQKVLRKHWPNIPIYDDVCTLTKERLDADGIGTIDIIHGGYPCQPFSNAGERKGAEDDRHLWPEVRRLIESIRPNWFVGENVAGHVTLGLDDVLSDLGDIGYTWQPFIIPASAVFAQHRRDRLFVVAYPKSLDQRGLSIGEKAKHARLTFCGENVADSDSEWKLQPQGVIEEFGGWVGNSGEDVSDSASKGLPQRRQTRIAKSASETTARVESESKRYRSGREQWATEPPVGRVANGIPQRVDRLKALGNAVVPQQIYPILAAIKQIDDMIKEETP